MACAIAGAVLLLLIVAAAAMGKHSCDICGAPLKKARHKWELHGKKTIACAPCNRRLEEKMSRDAVDRLLDAGGEPRRR